MPTKQHHIEIIIVRQLLFGLIPSHCVVLCRIRNMQCKAVHDYPILPEIEQTTTLWNKDTLM